MLLMIFYYFFVSEIPQKPETKSVLLIYFHKSQGVGFTIQRISTTSLTPTGTAVNFSKDQQWHP